MAATSPFNLTGLPVLSVPYAFSSEQLPIGIQLVGKWLDEATLLRLGAQGRPRRSAPGAVMEEKGRGRFGRLLQTIPCLPRKRLQDLH
jgi:hypothetical protein